MRALKLIIEFEKDFLAERFAHAVEVGSVPVHAFSKRTKHNFTYQRRALVSRCTCSLIARLLCGTPSSGRASGFLLDARAGAATKGAILERLRGCPLLDAATMNGVVYNPHSVVPFTTD